MYEVAAGLYMAVNRKPWNPAEVTKDAAATSIVSKLYQEILSTQPAQLACLKTFFELCFDAKHRNRPDARLFFRVRLPRGCTVPRTQLHRTCALN
jgi:hypothetical protein